MNIYISALDFWHWHQTCKSNDLLVKLPRGSLIQGERFINPGWHCWKWLGQFFVPFKRPSAGFCMFLCCLFLPCLAKLRPCRFLPFYQEEVLPLILRSGLKLSIYQEPADFLSSKPGMVRSFGSGYLWSGGYQMLRWLECFWDMTFG